MERPRSLPDVVEAWEAELLPLRQRRPDLRVPLVRTAIVLGSTRLEPATTLASGFELRFASMAAALDDLLEPPRVDVWDPPRRFVDLQASGTHALWHHTHDFERLAVGTVMRDTVRYRPPAGWLGSVAGGRRVASWVDRIFDDRARKIEERFGA